MLSSAAKRRQEIVFHIVPNLPYPVRILLSGTLFVSGVMVQAYGVMWVGVVAIFAGAVLLTTEGYKNIARTLAGGMDWKPARAEEVQRIIDINKKQRSWDIDAVDITNVLGFVTLAALAGGLGWWSFRMGGLETSLGRLIVFDSAAALLPFWVTGVRSFLKNDKLVIKADLLLQLYAYFRTQTQPEEQFLFQMQTAPAETGGEVPQDVKAMIRFPNGPEAFLGLQIQIAINNVNGSDFPYAYCVLVAKPGFDLSGRLARIGVCPGPDRDVGGTTVIIEAENSNEAEVMIFRQKTDGGGYRTKPKQAQSILGFTLDTARAISGTA